MKTWEKYLMFALLFSVTTKHCSETTLGEISALISSVISLAYGLAATIAVFRQNQKLTLDGEGATK